MVEMDALSKSAKQRDVKPPKKAEQQSEAKLQGEAKQQANIKQQSEVAWKGGQESKVVEGGSRSIRDQLLNSVSNDKLKNCINEMYRPGASIGDGGLADAIRYELTTGQLVGGKSHITKGLERVRNLENIIAKQNLSNADLKIATDLLNDLKEVLKLGGY